MTDQPGSTSQKQQPSKERIKGVFSTQILSKVGTGTTMRKTIQKSYWFANELDDQTIEIQPLNVNYVPSGPKNIIPKDEFLDKFSPEPEFYTVTVMPKMRELEKTVARGDRHRKRGETYSAELEYGNAIKVDEENVRANFGLGLTYLERGNTDKAQDIFERLVKIEAAYEPEHKHLFNEFGISLRKNKMIDQALAYYARALELSDNDENLYCNIARLYLEHKDIPNTLEMLRKALEINPDMPEANKFMAFLKNKGLVAS
ncbi:tetratricopeptide repeat protein [Desulfonatronum thioautotrophicum]|uniref:tetratricopeptide repeat protein n=1 Tax=Desulfonatronum thioautotrophicum TaxID=617001 RepID=UPI00069CB778|nr:tetratricopeptide repeat protein [Desulfonatronum thioautotrophicum]